MYIKNHIINKFKDYSEEDYLTFIINHLIRINLIGDFVVETDIFYIKHIEKVVLMNINTKLKQNEKKLNYSKNII